MKTAGNMLTSLISFQSKAEGNPQGMFSYIRKVEILTNLMFSYESMFSYKILLTESISILVLI